MKPIRRDYETNQDSYTNYTNYASNNYYNYDTIAYYQYQYDTQNPTQTMQYPQGQYPYYYYYYEDKALTGINYLDTYVLGGGFKKGEVYLIAGEAGTGKTIFSLTFLRTGADSDEVGMYVTVDEPSEDVKNGVRDALGWDLDTYERSGKLVLADFRTYFSVYARDEKITLNPRDLAKMIIEQVKKYDVKRLVIDPIAPLIIMSHQDVIWIREYLRELVFQLKKLKDVTTIMTSEIPTGEENKLSRFGVEEYLASGVIMLSLKELSLANNDIGCLMRVMFIRKMRWMPIRPIKLIYEIGPSGIYIIGPLNDETTLNYYRSYYCGKQTTQNYYYPQQYYTSQYYGTQQYPQ